MKTLTIPEVVLMRKLQASNHGIVRRDARPDYARIVKAALDRRKRDTERSPGEGS